MDVAASVAIELALLGLSRVINKLASPYFGGDVTSAEMEHLNVFVRYKIEALIRKSKFDDLVKSKPLLEKLQAAALELEDLLDLYEYNQIEKQALITQKLAELVDISGEVTPEVRLQAYVSARGFETGGRVRGYGEVVTPDMVPWVQETQPTSVVRRSRRGRAYALLQSECLSLKEMYEKQQMINENQGKEIEELRHMIQSSQNLSSNPQSSQEQPSSAQEESLNTNQQLVNQHQPPNQQPSCQQQPLFQQNLSYPQFGPVYYPHPYRPPSLYAQVSQPTRDFTATLNDMDFLQFMAHGSTSDK